MWVLGYTPSRRRLIAQRRERCSCSCLPPGNIPAVLLHSPVRLCLEPSPRHTPMQAEWFVKEGVGLSAEATMAEPVEGGELNRCSVGDGNRWRSMKHSDAPLSGF